MHFIHRPGDELQIDFAGEKSGWIFQKENGLAVSTGMRMPYSNYMYVEAIRWQKQEDFIAGLTNALAYFGGVPACIKCDNMKTAVSESISNFR